LQTTTRLWTTDNGKARLRLHPGQARAWNSDKRFVFVIAGLQSGKTSFGPWWLYREIQRHGPGDYLAVTASYDLFKLKMLPEILAVFEQALGIARYWSGARVLELSDPDTGQYKAVKADDPMWGRIILRSANAPGGLESATAQAAWLDECGQDGFTMEAWEAVQGRLSLSGGKVLGTTTPYNLGWLKSEQDRWERGDSDIEIINFPSYINPAFPKSEYDRMKNRIQAWRFTMRYDGRFAQPAGLVYNVFDSATMTVDPFPIPTWWQRIVGIDFGGANTAILWLAENPDTHVWYVYQEWLGGGGTSAQYTKKAREGLFGAKTWKAYGGSSGEGQYRRDWTAAGFRVQEPLVSGVEAGIDRVTSLMQNDQLRVFKSCRGLLDELGTYRRKTDGEGNVLDEIVDKRKFHRLDALRYACPGIKGYGPSKRTIKRIGR